MSQKPTEDYSFCQASPAFEGLSADEIASILSTARPLEVAGGESSFSTG
jgi:hypothetical protein